PSSSPFQASVASRTVRAIPSQRISITLSRGIYLSSTQARRDSASKTNIRLHSTSLALPQGEHSSIPSQVGNLPVDWLLAHVLQCLVDRRERTTAEELLRGQRRWVGC